MSDFPQDLTQVVNSEHWSQFNAVHPLVNQVFGICYLTLTLLCTISSLLIVYVFVTVEELRIPSNYFIINLAMSDFLIFLTQGPMMCINAFTSRFWIFGPTACRLYGWIGGVTGK